MKDGGFLLSALALAATIAGIDRCGARLHLESTPPSAVVPEATVDSIKVCSDGAVVPGQHFCADTSTLHFRVTHFEAFGAECVVVDDRPAICRWKDGDDEP